MNLYVASSWRNQYYLAVVERLKKESYLDVYDFRNPVPADIPGSKGFSWSEIDPNWKEWTFHQYKQALQFPIAERGFDYDMQALKGAAATLLVMPCGRSAHLELGYALGRDQLTIVYIPKEERPEPELMYKMVDLITDDLEEAVEKLKEHELRYFNGSPL